MFTKYLLKKQVQKTSKIKIHKNRFFHKKTRHAIPKMPVLDDMVNSVIHYGLPVDLGNTAVVMVQHMTECTLSLIEAIIRIGVKPNNFYLIGKCYSSSEVILDEARRMGIHMFPDEKPVKAGGYKTACLTGIDRLWRKFGEDAREKYFDRLYILDEGGHAIGEMNTSLKYKYPIAAVEHTSAGLRRKSVLECQIPLIQLASSAVKLVLEPPLIANAVLEKTKSILFKKGNEKKVFGIAGNGYIGKAIARYLNDNGYAFIVYDPNEKAFSDMNFSVKKAYSIENLIDQADIIIGCSGKDLFSNFNIFDFLNEAQEDKTFVSCSSEDKEFLTLLQQINQKGIEIIDPLKDIQYKTKHQRNIHILNGGYPVNFDQSPIGTRTKDMELIMGALFAALLQAIFASIRYTKKIPETFTIFEHFKTQGSLQKLDPFVQKFIVKSWGKNRYDEGISKFDNIDWIIENSGGEYVEYPDLKNCFSIQNPNLHNSEFEYSR